MLFFFFFVNGEVRFGAVFTELHRTAPYDFSSHKTAPIRTAGLSKQKFRTGPHRAILKNKIHTEPRSGLRVFKFKYFATMGVRCGVVIISFFRTVPHHMIFRTAP